MTDRKIVDYIIVSRQGDRHRNGMMSELEGIVKLRISQGYEPLGAPFIEYQHSGHVDCIIQAMVKYED